MIQTVINQFEEQAREHKAIQSFTYTLDIDHAVTGNEIYPMLWLEAPIYVRTSRNETLTLEANFQILFREDKSYQNRVKHQDLAFMIGLNIIERIKRDKKKLTITSFSFVSIEQSSNNDTNGGRFTLFIDFTNIANLCDIDLHFDKDKELAKKENVNLDLKVPDGCTFYSKERQKIDLTLSSEFLG